MNLSSMVKQPPKKLSGEESEMEVGEVLYQGFCFIFRANRITLSSMDFFHRAQVSHVIFQGFLMENVGFFTVSTCFVYFFRISCKRI